MSIVAISKGGTPSSFVDLSERKKVLCKEIEHLRWIKGQLEAAHEKTVAYLQKQQNQWDEKNERFKQETKFRKYVIIF